MRIWTPWYHNWSNSKKSSSYKNIDDTWRKRIIPDWWHSSDNRKYWRDEKSWRANKSEWKAYWLSKKQSKWEIIQEWLYNYFGVDDDINPEDFIIIVNWVTINVLEFDESKDLWVESFNAGKFWFLAVSDKIWINQKKKDINFFDLLNRWWKLFLLNPNYKLSYKSLLKVELNNWESEVMPAWLFLKYLWETSKSSKIDFTFDYLIKKYDINWSNNINVKKYNDINYFWWNTSNAA